MKPRRCPVTIKIQHATRKAAKLHVRRLAQEGDDGLEPYRCRWCGRWHVGHKMGWRKDVCQVIRRNP